MAARPFQAGDVVARLPAACSISLGPASSTASMADMAYALLQRLHQDAVFNRMFAPFLAAMPAAHDLPAPDTLGHDELEALQTPEMVRLCVFCCVCVWW